MKLEQFEQVLEIVRTGTFSQAARNLYLSQPNLSQSVKQLEDELGCRIFDRTSDGVVPTEKGRELIEYISAIQSQYDLLRRSSREPFERKERLSVVTVNMHRCIPYFVETVKEYKDTPISFSLLNCLTIDDAIQQVESCIADLAVFGITEHRLKKVLAKLEQKDIEYHHISRNVIQAAVGPENEYYNRDSIHVEDLASQTLLTFGNIMNNPLGALWDYHQSGIVCRGRISVDNNHLFYELVSHTNAVGLISGETGKKRYYHQDHWPDIRILPLSGYEIYGEVGWIHLKRIQLPQAAYRFVSAFSSAE